MTISCRLHPESDAASLYGAKADGLRGIRSGRQIPPDKTPLVQGFHWFRIGRLVRYDLERFHQWLTEPKAIHQRRIDEHLNGSATPIEGVRSPGRPRRKEVAQ
jgi:hypothetical protein